MPPKGLEREDVEKGEQKVKGEYEEEGRNYIEQRHDTKKGGPKFHMHFETRAGEFNQEERGEGGKKNTKKCLTKLIRVSLLGWHGKTQK